MFLFLKRFYFRMDLYYHYFLFLNAFFHFIHFVATLLFQMCSWNLPSKKGNLLNDKDMARERWMHFSFVSTLSRWIVTYLHTLFLWGWDWSFWSGKKWWSCLYWGFYLDIFLLLLVAHLGKIHMNELHSKNTCHHDCL